MKLEFTYVLFLMTRFGIGRFTTEEEIDYTADLTIRHVTRLREMRYFSMIIILYGKQE